MSHLVLVCLWHLLTLRHGQKGSS